MNDGIKRDKRGLFQKGGKSANPAGRPRKKPLIVAEELDPEIRKLCKDNPLKVLLHLMNTATDEDKRFKYAKAVIDYVNPKLSSIKQEINKKETFIIERADGFKLGEMKNSKEYVDVTPMNKEEIDLQKEVTDRAQSILKSKSNDRS